MPIRMSIARQQGSRCSPVTRGQQSPIALFVVALLLISSFSLYCSASHLDYVYEETQFEDDISAGGVSRLEGAAGGVGGGDQPAPGRDEEQHASSVAPRENVLIDTEVSQENQKEKQREKDKDRAGGQQRERPHRQQQQQQEQQRHEQHAASSGSSSSGGGGIGGGVGGGAIGGSGGGGGHHAIVHPLQYGVHHAELSGPLRLEDGSTVVVQMRVFYKAAVRGDELVVRAQAHFFDSVKDLLLRATTDLEDEDGNKLAITFPFHEPPLAMQALAEQPALHLQPAHHGRVLWPESGVDRLPLRPLGVGALDKNLVEAVGDPSRRVYRYEGGAHNTTLPLLLEATLPPHEAAAAAGVTDFYLCVAGWAYCANVPYPTLRGSAAPLLPAGVAPEPAEAGDAGADDGAGSSSSSGGSGGGRRLREQRERFQPAAFVSVYTPLAFGGFPLASHLLETHVRYHQEVGVGGALLYERGSYLPELLGHAGLGQLMQDGTLRVMLWTTELSGAPPLSAAEDQLFRYELHGLSYDTDIVYNHAVLAHWGRNTYLYFADISDFLVLPEGGSLPAVVAPGDGLCGGNGYFEAASYLQLSRWSYWCDGPSQAALAAALDAAPAASVPPTRHQTCVRRNPEGKRDKPRVVAHADAVAYVEVAYAHLWEEGGAVDKARWGPEDCVTVAHLPNLAKNRSAHVEPETELLTGWLWPIERLLAARKGRGGGGSGSGGDGSGGGGGGSSGGSGGGGKEQQQQQQAAVGHRPVLVSGAYSHHHAKDHRRSRASGSGSSSSAGQQQRRRDANAGEGSDSDPDSSSEGEAVRERLRRHRQVRKRWQMR